MTLSYLKHLFLSTVCFVSFLLLPNHAQAAPSLKHGINLHGTAHQQERLNCLARKKFEVRGAQQLIEEVRNCLYKGLPFRVYQDLRDNECRNNPRVLSACRKIGWDQVINPFDVSRKERCNVALSLAKERLREARAITC